MTGRYYALDNNPLHLCLILASALICLVVGVSDDDTLTAQCGEPGRYEQVKVRLQGSDALERKRKQPFGERARQAPAELTFQKKVELRCTNTDRYKRQVCSVVRCSRISPDRAGLARSPPDVFSRPPVQVIERPIKGTQSPPPQGVPARLF